MGQQIHCVPICYAACALSVQKIYFILQKQKELYISLKPATGKHLTM